MVSEMCWAHALRGMVVPSCYERNVPAFPERNMPNMRQSRPDSGLGFEIKVKRFKFLFSLRSGWVYRSKTVVSRSVLAIVPQLKS